jgi:small neutral amino acid transporter SnatA (MarC family)
MNLSELSLQIGGGVILFPDRPAHDLPRSPAVRHTGQPAGEPLIVPLAVPAIAGPSALATVLLLVSQAPDRRLEWVGALVHHDGRLRRWFWFSPSVFSAWPESASSLRLSV